MEISLEVLHKITAHFHLRSREIGKLAIIYLVIRVKGRQYKYSTGLRVYPEQWDRKRQRAVVCAHFTEICNKHNSLINKELISIWRLYEDWRLRIAENPMNFRLFNIKKYNKMKKQNAVIQLIKLLNEQKMKDSSRGTYLKEIKSFEDFLMERKGKKVIEWSEMTLGLLAEYQKWLYKLTVKHKITGETVFIEDNTAQDKFKHFYTLLTYAERAEYIDLAALKLNKLNSKKNKRDQVQENQIYLTEEEISRILSLPLQGICDQARDLFIVQVESGQRYEDINGLNLGMDDKDTCTIATEKTGAIITFAISPILKQLQRKYNGRFPRISKIQTNRLLKEIGKQAGLTRKHVAAEHRGGKLYKYEAEAWKFLSTHTARRSFITNNVDKCDPQILMKITGHRTTSAFSRYNRLTSQDACSIFMGSKKDISTSNIERGETDPIKEQKEVLMMLGYDPIKLYDMSDADTLRRELVHVEDKLIQELGFENVSPLKAIFNEFLPLKDRKEKIEILRAKYKDMHV